MIAPPLVVHRIRWSVLKMVYGVCANKTVVSGMVEFMIPVTSALLATKDVNALAASEILQAVPEVVVQVPTRVDALPDGTVLDAVRNNAYFIAPVCPPQDIVPVVPVVPVPNDGAVVPGPVIV